MKNVNFTIFNLNLINFQSYIENLDELLDLDELVNLQIAKPGRNSWIGSGWQLPRIGSDPRQKVPALVYTTSYTPNN